jgi:hypothetical protein
MIQESMDTLAEFLSKKLGIDEKIIAEHIASWENQENSYSITALYDKGFGPECLNLPNITAKNDQTARKKAEEVAAAFFLKQFGKKVVFDEINVRRI